MQEALVGFPQAPPRVEPVHRARYHPKTKIKNKGEPLEETYFESQPGGDYSPMSLFAYNYCK